MSPKGKVAKKRSPKKESKKLKPPPVQKTPEVAEAGDSTEKKIPIRRLTSEEVKHALAETQVAPDGVPSRDDQIADSPLPMKSPQTVDSHNDDFITQAVKFLNEKANETLYVGALEIGTYVLKNFFNDDITLATSRNPKKPTSYQELCNHPGLFVKPEALGVMVRVAAQEQFFAINKMKTDSLSYSHKAELVKLPNDKAKISLVKACLKKSLSVRQLSEQVSKAREKHYSERGLLGTYLVEKIFSPGELFEDPRRQALFHDEDKRKEYLKGLKSKTRRTLSEKVGEAVEKAKGWVNLYEEMLKDLEEIELEKKSRKP